MQTPAQCVLENTSSLSSLVNTLTLLPVAEG